MNPPAPVNLTLPDASGAKPNLLMWLNLFIGSVDRDIIA